jgi:hypothetical protein
MNSYYGRHYWAQEWATWATTGGGRVMRVATVIAEFTFARASEVAVATKALIALPLLLLPLPVDCT